MFRSGGQSERYRDYAGDIHSSGAHLLSLINDLLDVAKIEAGRMDISPSIELDTARVFDIALKLIGAKAREKDQHPGHRGRRRLPRRPLWADERAAEADADQPCVSNAVKFTPQWAGASR